MFSITRFELDFARRRRPPALAWVMLIAGALSLLATLPVLHGAWQAQVAVREQAAGLAMAARPVTVRPIDRSPREAARAAAEQDDARRIWRDLHRPWAELLDSVEALAGPRALLLQASVDAGFTQLNVLAETRDLAEAMALVERLSRQAPVRGARLLQHEWRDAAGGARVVAVRIVADLDAQPGVPQPVAPVAALGPDPAGGARERAR